jgi:hypothetical protein
MAEPDKNPVTLEELLVSSLAQTDALAKLLIEKGLITREEPPSFPLFHDQTRNLMLMGRADRKRGVAPCHFGAGFRA